MKSRNPWDNFRFEFALYINEEAKKTENAKKPINDTNMEHDKA